MIKNIGEEYIDNIESAMKDIEIKEQIKNMMKEDKIQLLNENNKPKYKNEIAHVDEVNVDESPTRSMKDDVSDNSLAIKKKVSVKVDKKEDKF